MSSHSHKVKCVSMIFFCYSLWSSQQHTYSQNLEFPLPRLSQHNLHGFISQGGFSSPAVQCLTQLNPFFNVLRDIRAYVNIWQPLSPPSGRAGLCVCVCAYKVLVCQLYFRFEFLNDTIIFAARFQQGTRLDVSGWSKAVGICVRAHVPQCCMHVRRERDTPACACGWRAVELAIEEGYGLWKSW